MEVFSLSIRFIAQSDWHVIDMCGTSQVLHCIMEGVLNPRRSVYKGTDYMKYPNRTAVIPYLNQVTSQHYRNVWIMFQNLLLNWKQTCRASTQQLLHLKICFWMKKSMLHHTFILALGKIKPSTLMKCWDIFVFYVTANWTTMEWVLKIWQNYTLMRKFSVLICTDCPIILFNSKNHKEYIGKKL